MRTLALCAVFWSVLSGGFGFGLAHTTPTPKVLTLHFDKEGVVIDIHHTISAGTVAARMRRDSDRDGNGQLDSGERAQLLRTLVTRATFALRLACGEDSVDAAPLGEPQLDGAKAPVRSSKSLHLTMRLHAPWPNAPDELTVALLDRIPEASSPVLVRWRQKQISACLTKPSPDTSPHKGVFLSPDDRLEWQLKSPTKPCKNKQ